MSAVLVEPPKDWPMPPRLSIAQIEAQTRVLSEVRKEIQALSKDDLHFLDDDIYVYDMETKEVKREIHCSEPDARSVRYHGVHVLEGQTWVHGLSAKRLGLWRKS